MFTWEHTADGLIVNGEVDIFTVDTFHQVVLQSAARGRFRLDLTRVERVDTAAAQVLAALCRSQGADGLSLRLSAGVEAILTRLGLDGVVAPCLGGEADG